MLHTTYEFYVIGYKRMKMELRRTRKVVGEEIAGREGSMGTAAAVEQ